MIAVERFTAGLYVEVFAVLDRHGYQRGDHAALGAAVAALLDLVEAYEGQPSVTADAPVPPATDQLRRR